MPRCTGIDMMVARTLFLVAVLGAAEALAELQAPSIFTGIVAVAALVTLIATKTPYSALAMSFTSLIVTLSVYAAALHAYRMHLDIDAWWQAMRGLAYVIVDMPIAVMIAERCDIVKRLELLRRRRTHEG